MRFVSLREGESDLNQGNCFYPKRMFFGEVSASTPWGGFIESGVVHLLLMTWGILKQSSIPISWFMKVS